MNSLLSMLHLNSKQRNLYVYYIITSSHYIHLLYLERDRKKANMNRNSIRSRKPRGLKPMQPCGRPDWRWQKIHEWNIVKLLAGWPGRTRSSPISSTGLWRTQLTSLLSWRRKTKKKKRRLAWIWCLNEGVRRGSAIHDAAFAHHVIAACYFHLFMMIISHFFVPQIAELEEQLKEQKFEAIKEKELVVSAHRPRCSPNCH